MTGQSIAQYGAGHKLKAVCGGQVQRARRTGNGPPARPDKPIGCQEEVDPKGSDPFQMYEHGPLPAKMVCPQEESGQANYQALRRS